MFYLYVFAAVAGGLLVLVSLLGGGQHPDQSDGSDHGQSEADGDAAASGEAHGDVAAAHGDGHGDGGHGDGHGDGHADAHGLAVHDQGHGHGHDGDGMASGVPTALLWLMSIQVWTYLLAFGGLTGLLLRTVAKVPEPVCGLSALAVGMTTALLARAAMRRLSVTRESGTLVEEKMVGSTAEVLIPAPAGGTGKVRLEVAGQTVDLLARASDGGPLAAGATVTILDVRDNEAEVSVSRQDESPKTDVQRGAIQAGRSAQGKGQ